ncbi:hypothetical protein CLTEP_15130 [Clostridium tepidiprofundi DSM 19306]|uniref:Uncharacterized protein n=1 Tax=Clostridium tepidiprofundi DSM 19306 TaxID=1121338 RepID=A0A151B3U6_9CLOT|nr:hypothetical protein [Clostridium tepidiprofundi]KYH34585.1 hypothetical protein CLTEP_15130 [Clostridium tepidiprofundi DSM 19306]
MKIVKTIIEILCFALVIMFLYAWGYVKEQRKSQELLREINKKAEKKIMKALKKNGGMTRKEIEGELMNIKVSLFLSKNKAVIKEPKMISKQILDKMLKEGKINIDSSKMPKRYVLK